MEPTFTGAPLLMDRVISKLRVTETPNGKLIILVKVKRLLVLSVKSRVSMLVDTTLRGAANRVVMIGSELTLPLAAFKATCLVELLLLSLLTASKKEERLGSR